MPHPPSPSLKAEDEKYMLGKQQKRVLLLIAGPSNIFCFYFSPVCILL